MTCTHAHLVKVSEHDGEELGDGAAIREVGVGQHDEREGKARKDHGQQEEEDDRILKVRGRQLRAVNGQGKAVRCS